MTGNMSKYYLNNYSIIDFSFCNVIIKRRKIACILSKCKIIIYKTCFCSFSYKNQKNKIITNKFNLNLISTEKSVFLLHL